MAVISGIGGGVQFAAGSGYAAEVRSWNMSVTAEAIDTTNMAPTSNFRTRIPGLKSGSGSFSCFVDDTVFDTIFGGLGDTSASLKLKVLSDLGTKTDFITCPCVITDVSVTASTESAVEIECSFESNGAITVTEAA